MKEVNCPHCNQVFEMDAAGYADILKQIKDAEFENELNARLNDAQEKHTMAIKLAKNEVAEEKTKESADKDKQIQRLKNELESAETKAKLEVNEATSPLQIEVMNLKNKISTAETEKELLEKTLTQSHQVELSSKDEIIRMKDEEIALRKEMKIKLSTKMVGETLEQHCENQFNTLRATAFPNAYFEKDNDVVEGSKGDYVYRELDENGVEIISIMFEMKNENDETKTKKKNDHFLKELDKDRNVKNCEYAVLVSLLEIENDLYNNGIVDKSHKFDKMYVVRPQSFIPMITVLRNAALKSLQVKNELALIKSQNIDIENFEHELSDFQKGFSRNYDLATGQFSEAIKRIDNSIAQMNKVKENLLKSGNNYRLANDKAQDLSIKKLTRNNQTMKVKFDNLKSDE
jgi:hypothetical protein